MFYLWNFVCSEDFNAFCEFVVLGRNKLDMSWFCICLMTIWRECHWILMSVLFWTCSKVRWDAALTQRHWKYFCLNSQSDEDKTSCFWGNLVQSFKFGLLQTRFFLHLNSEFLFYFLPLVWIIGVNLVVHLTVNLLQFQQISEYFNNVFCPLRFLCSLDFKTLWCKFVILGRK